MKGGEPSPPARQSDHIKGTSDTWTVRPALVTPQTRDAPHTPVSQGKREILRERPGQLSHLPPPPVGIAPPRHGGLTYSRAGGEQQGGLAA